MWREDVEKVPTNCVEDTKMKTICEHCGLNVTWQAICPHCGTTVRIGRVINRNTKTMRTGGWDADDKVIHTSPVVDWEKAGMQDNSILL